ncbi:DNA polymerase III subunit gamma/tau [Marinospirillum sp. MEB164]|uniref:DNA polymerase III subunit gamma/tau n=1 Tax=Marinospirillum alkalitolerans TaxID=3123374 RepID=A0ABW8PUC5_9GAMM
MSYQVLARKWRPKNFHQLVGQDQVRTALVNALDQDRLHHAYLFTGTRGVGKTTLARILAKCLNCETGMTSQPCGVCSACSEIDAGRFVDLIEVDAASRTKVEDTRELLDNVQYAPTRGRFKVYLIDEVHMLSTHSFNALLKTLEEPPPHVKFLLATTDPQKLPVTVLSRCLQFQLKNMSPEKIVGHLQHLLQEEQVGYEEPALWLLARAADGSMRDALSLTDQAIAYGDGYLATAQIAQLLGVLDHRHLLELLEALIAQDAAGLLAQVAELAQQAPDFAAVLQELASLLHRMTLAQCAPAALPPDVQHREKLLGYARQLPAEDLQLFYQIAIEGRRDLPLAPDPRTGLEMTLLRMLAFKPQGIPELPAMPLPSLSPPPVEEEVHSPKQSAADVLPASSSAAELTDVSSDASPPATQNRPPWEAQVEEEALHQPPSSPSAASRPTTETAEPLAVTLSAALPEVSSVIAPSPAVEPHLIIEPHPVAASRPEEPQLEEAHPEEAHQEETQPAVIASPTPSSSLVLEDNESWLRVFDQLPLNGWQSAQLRQLCLLSRQQQQLVFGLPPQAAAFFDASMQDTLAELLQPYCPWAEGRQPQIVIQADQQLGLDSVILRRQKNQQQRLEQTEQALRQHPQVQELQALFDAELDVQTLQPRARQE